MHFSKQQGYTSEERAKTEQQATVNCYSRKLLLRSTVFTFASGRTKTSMATTGGWPQTITLITPGYEHRDVLIYLGVDVWTAKLIFIPTCDRAQRCSRGKRGMQKDNMV